MQSRNSTPWKTRVSFLLLLAIGITLMFFWVIKSFVMALVMAAVLAGLVHPFYCRVSELFGKRKSIASAVTVLLSLVLVIIPVLVFLGILIGEAIQISESAGNRLGGQVQQGTKLPR